MRAEQERRGRPRAGAASNVSHDDTSRVPRPAEGLADLDALAERLRGRFVVQVAIEGDRYRTHVYRNVAAAERAVDRAKARGQRAHVTLVQMLPVGVVIGLGGVA